MQNIKKIVLLCLLPIFVQASNYEVNAGGTKKPPTTYSKGICSSTNYDVSFSQDEYMLYGLRVSFFDNDTNEQVGNTIDVWN